jgi:hypothetical protein
VRQQRIVDAFAGAQVRQASAKGLGEGNNALRAKRIKYSFAALRDSPLSSALKYQDRENRTGLSRLTVDA